MQFFDDVRVGIEQDERSGALNVYLDQGPFRKRVTVGTKKDSPAAKELLGVLISQEMKALSRWHDAVIDGVACQLSMDATSGVITGFLDLDVYMGAPERLHQSASSRIASMTVQLFQPKVVFMYSKVDAAAQRDIASHLGKHLSVARGHKVVPFVPESSDVTKTQTPIGSPAKETPISAIVGQFTPLRAEGELLFGPCPLHTALGSLSLSVDDRRGSFSCLECGATGDAMDFLLKMAKKANR